MFCFQHKKYTEKKPTCISLHFAVCASCHTKAHIYRSSGPVALYFAMCCVAYGA